MKILLFVTLMNSILLIELFNPMLITIMILIQALTLCILIWWFLSIPWFSYIMFLIFLGGLMIIFSYICSLASNEEIKFNFNKSSIYLMTLMLITYYMNFKNFELLMLNSECIMMFYKMMSFYLISPSIIMMFYLLFTLIVIVKMTNKNMGAIRTKKKYVNS